MSKILPKTIVLLSGQECFIKCVNPKNISEWSIYRIRICDDDFKGEGLSNVFLSETTGYSDDE